MRKEDLVIDIDQTLPPEWKTASVSPIRKAGPTEAATNYMQNP